MCRASRAQACSVCTPLLEAIEWPSVRTMRASTRASQHARRCASPRAVCAGVARAFTSLLHGRVSCHVVMSVILFPQVNACGQLESIAESLCDLRLHCVSQSSQTDERRRARRGERTETHAWADAGAFKHTRRQRAHTLRNVLFRWWRYL